MNFGRYDLVILVSMSLSIVLLSYLFPAVGLADASNETQTSDIPEFDIDADRFDMAGEFPNQPGTATSGVLEYDESLNPPTGIRGKTVVFIDKPEDNGVSIEIENQTVTNNFDIRVRNWNSGQVIGGDNYNITAEGDKYIHRNFSTQIEFEVTDLENFNQPNMTAKIDYEVLEAPSSSSGGGLSAIPIIGGMFEAGAKIASVLGWIGTVVWWGVVFIFEVAVNLLGAMFDTLVFSFGLASWMTTSYGSVIAGASSWAAVVLLIPSILLFAEFAKISFIAISLLPTT